MADRTGGLADVGRSVSAVAIAVTGVAVLAAPAIGRLVGRLDQERRLRVREEERAALAAHLHDSVLQSLVLIQRADDPKQMTSLARRQERELRSWLYGGRTEAEPTTLQGAVEAMTAAIELDHAVRVDAVTVGDQPLDEAATAMLGVLREATTNAARHAQVEHVDVYVEVDSNVADRVRARHRDRLRSRGGRGRPEGDHRVGRRAGRAGRREGHRGESAGRRHRGRDPHPEGQPVTAPIRLVLVDDHALIRAGVRSELTRSGVGAPTIEVVGEADSVEDAVAVIRTTRPDVVLLDVHLPGGGGHAVIEGLRGDKLETRYLALSVSDAADDVIGVVRAGARGYVTKTIAADDLREAVVRVHGGDAVFSPRLAGFVLDAFASDEPVPLDPELDRLTAREREVLRLIARGYTYKEVASRLCLSVKTIETHVSAVLRKLQLSNRHQLTVWANERRLI